MALPINEECQRMCADIGVCREMPPKIREALCFESSVSIKEVSALQLRDTLKTTTKLLREYFPLMPNVITFAQLQDFKVSPMPFKQDPSKKYILCVEEPLEFKITVPYVHLTRDQIYSLVLPPTEFATSFETIGHIAHFNTFSETQMRYKNFIGLVNLSASVRTVVLKKGQIENAFRTYDFELLAGLPVYETIVNQSGFKFKVDIQKVYWNSRLGEEHQQLVRKIDVKEDEFVLDGTGGVGPFAIPLSVRGLKVLCNDLNADCFRLLQENIALNKCDSIIPMNCDCMELLKKYLVEPFDYFQQENELPTKLWMGAVIINLPELSIDFLKAFRNVKPKCVPKFFIEVFTRFEIHFEQELMMRVVAARFGWGFLSQQLGSEFVDKEEFGCDSISVEQVQQLQAKCEELNKYFKGFEARIVRDVGTAKWMACVEFQFDEKACAAKRSKK